jgi:hypothetical protein
VNVEVIREQPVLPPPTEYVISMTPDEYKALCYMMDHAAAHINRGSARCAHGVYYRDLFDAVMAHDERDAYEKRNEPPDR